MATLGTSDNDNEPWSEMEIADLRSGLGFGASIEETAAFLLRDPEEVRQKVQDTLVHRFLGTDHFGRIHMIHDGLYLGF
jgi:hypothetical protein